MGMVGIHIVQKTPFAPQWIWSTFEQIDNVSPIKGDQVDPKLPPIAPRFTNPGCPVEETFCFWRPFLAPVLFNPTPCCPNAELNRFPGLGFSRTTPNQITRLDPIQGSGLNQKFQPILADIQKTLLAEKKSPGGPPFPPPFQYYVLVNTQWPLNGINPITKEVNTRPCKLDINGVQQVGPNCYTLVPLNLRNSVVESYMTDYFNNTSGKPVQKSNRSCLGCHGNAGTDFSYIFLDAVEQRVKIK